MVSSYRFLPFYLFHINPFFSYFIAKERKKEEKLNGWHQSLHGIIHPKSDLFFCLFTVLSVGVLHEFNHKKVERAFLSLSISLIYHLPFSLFTESLSCVGRKERSELTSCTLHMCDILIHPNEY